MRSIYIYPFNEEKEELYDSLKKSLDYYNHGDTDEMIALKMKEYMEKKQNIQNALDLFPYEMQMVIPDQKVIRGEKKKQNRTCIYCGGSIKDGKTKFKEIAHAIPEALGNTKFIQNEECDDCNNFFAGNAEEDLCNLFVWKRLKYGLKGKNGYPVFQFTHSRYAKYFNYEKEDYESDWRHFESVKTFVKENKVLGPIFVSRQMPKNSEKIEVSYYQRLYTPNIFIKL